MFEFLVPPGARVPAPHCQEACDEIGQGLQDPVTTTLDGAAHQVAHGGVQLVPPGAVITTRTCMRGPRGP